MKPEIKTNDILRSRERPPKFLVVAKVLPDGDLGICNRPYDPWTLSKEGAEKNYDHFPAGGNDATNPA